MSAPCRYLAPRIEGGEVVIECVDCSPSRLPTESAAQLLDPLLGLTGPFGRFITGASIGERARLAFQLAELLVDRPAAR